MIENKIGSFGYPNGKKIEYFLDEFESFCKENGEELFKDDLKNWAVWLNSPWSQAHEHYEISVNCKDAYTEMDENDPTWKCEYSIVGYELFSASVIGYGNTEIEALEDCIGHFKYLQEKYNPEGESC